MKKKIKIILVFLFMGLIFYFSNQPAGISDDQTHSVLGVVNKIFSYFDLSPETKLFIKNNAFFLLRKGAHFTMYLVLGFIVASLFRDVLHKKPLYYSLAFCTLYAIADEVHQYFIPGRSCELRDVIIDVCGSLTGILIYIFYRKKVKPKVKKILKRKIVKR